MSNLTSARSKKAWYKAKDVRSIFVIWLFLTIVLAYGAINLTPKLMGVQASDTMEDVVRTMVYFTVAAAPVAALVWSIALYSLFGWRYKGKSIPSEDGPALHSNTKVISTWVVVSSVLCLGLLVWGLSLVSSNASENAPAEESLVVNVYGQQWAWTYSYPDNGNVESHDLYLPIDKHVVFRVTSYDVVHSFWIPEMGMKIDANPGAITETKTTPTKLGEFTVRCAELCGLYHSQMQNLVHVVSEADFTAWINDQELVAMTNESEGAK